MTFFFKGPSNPDVFEPFVDGEHQNISEEVLKESKLIQGEIMLLLNKVSFQRIVDNTCVPDLIIQKYV